MMYIELDKTGKIICAYSAKPQHTAPKGHTTIQVPTSWFDTEISSKFRMGLISNISELKFVQGPPDTVAAISNTVSNLGVERLRSEKINYVLNQLDALQYSPITVNKTIFQCDMVTIGRIESFINAFQNGWSPIAGEDIWFDSLNNPHTMTLSLLSSIHNAFIDRSNKIFISLKV